MPSGIWLALHLLGLIIWLGPTAGAAYLVYAGEREGSKTLQFWLWRRVGFLLNVEHWGLLLVIISGIALAASMGVDPRSGGWLFWKLVLIGAIIVPVEALDIYLTNVKLGPALAKATSLDDPDLQLPLHRYHRFFRWGLVPFSLTVTAVVLLSVLRPF